MDAGPQHGTLVKTQDPQSPANSPFFVYFNEIGIIAQLSGALFQRALPAGLNNSQFAVLNWFSRVDSEASPGRLAKAFQVTPGAMTNTLKKLEAKGLVRIEPDESSGRRKKVTLTEAGEALRRSAIAAAAPLFQEFAERFPAADIERQIEELAQVREYLDRQREG